MSNAPDLVRRLAADLEPVSPLPSPLRRGLTWAAWSTVVLLAVGLATGIREDWPIRVGDPGFIVATLAALATGLAAAVAALVVSLPDRPSWAALIPLPPFLVWVSSISYGCLTSWVAISDGSVTLKAATTCLGIVAATSIPLAAISAIMLRHAARLQPRLVSLLAALAVTGTASFALNWFHQLEASALVLIWNVGMAAILSILATIYGHLFLAWGGLSRRIPGRR